MEGTKGAQVDVAVAAHEVELKSGGFRSLGPFRIRNWAAATVLCLAAGPSWAWLLFLCPFVKGPA
jgi:hypothetical protein